MSYPVLRLLTHDDRFAGATVAYPETTLFQHLSCCGLPPLSPSVVAFKKQWYAFDPEDWGSIEGVMQQWDISVVINLQNEGPRYDNNYYRFKESHGTVEFWDLDFDEIYSGRRHIHILESVRNMLASHDVPWWYPPRGDTAGAGRSGAAIYVGGSEMNKRWETGRWSAVIHQMASAYPNETFAILTGISGDEQEEALSIARDVAGLPNVEVFGARQELPVSARLD